MNSNPLFSELMNLKTLKCKTLSEFISTGETIEIPRYKMVLNELTKKRERKVYGEPIKTLKRTHVNPSTTKPGVYAFWWTGDRSLLLKEKGFHPELRFKNSKGELVPMNVYDFWNSMEINIEAKEPVPLYIGKAGNIYSRYKQHLMLKTPRLLPNGIEAIKQYEKFNGKKYNTSVQLRDRIDRVFPEVKDTLGLILNNVGYSYVEVEDTYKRASLEYMAIGYYASVFNTDIER
ncbi:hypothetical protein [Paenibacillus sp. Y412MC10]|uniref:hypothetical protein n=1 Tax=Geobacillus sp. (strain Y412MC10) TaxID=481743 RepID=UPI0011AB5A74|nr:hypothetical protein [Paenibacillus sp. Y412MC10]